MFAVSTMAAIRLVVVVTLCVSAGVAQDSTNKYDVAEAYRIYSLLIPYEESSQRAKGTLVIQQETVSIPHSDICLSPEAATKFKDAVDDFVRVNTKRWVLEPRFAIDKPYQLVSTATLNRGWASYRKTFPDSGGSINLSAVGFNKDKTRAIVYSGSSCGELCGRWSFHLFEKLGGEWKQVPGVSCFTVS